MTPQPLKAVPKQKEEVEAPKGTQAEPIQANPKRRKRAKLGTVRVLTKTLIVSVALLSAVCGTLWYRMDAATARAEQLATQIDHVFVERAVAAILKTNPQVPEAFARELVWTVIEMSMRYEIDARIALGKLGVESAFNPKALSKTGARGLSQVMPGVWVGELQREGIIDTSADLYEMRPSIEAGLYILRYELNRYQENYRRALAVYNAGPGGDAGDYPEQVAKFATRF